MPLSRLHFGSHSISLNPGLTPTGPSGPTGPVGATNYSTRLNTTSGYPGATFSYIATPDSGGWQANETISVTVSGGTADQTTQTPTGSGAVTFIITPSVGAGNTVTVNSTGSPTTNRSGSQSYSVIAVANPTGAVNRFDILISNSAGDTNTAQTISAVPNGIWQGGSLTFTATKNGGSATDISTITLPSTGSATQTIGWTPPSAGEWKITGSNTKGMYNPYGAPFNCFAAASGNATSLTVGSNFLDQQPFQQDCWTGTPTNWTAINGASFGMGWGEFWAQITPGANSSGIFARLIDSDSSGASTSSGGTIISNIAQVYGAVTGGSQTTIRILVPSSDYTYYIELATNSAFSNPVRIPLRFRICDIIGIETPSQEDMWLQSYPYNGQPGNLNWSNYTKTMLCGAQNTAGVSTAQWFRADGVTQHDSTFASWGNVASMEAGRRFFNRKGTGCAVVGVAQVGATVDGFIAADGSPSSGFVDAISYCNHKFRYLRVDVLNGWGGAYASESYAEYQLVFGAHVTKMLTTYPALAVIGFSTGVSGQYGPDGSANFGYMRLNKIITEQIEPTNPCVISTDNNVDWNEFFGGHASWASQTRFVRSVLLSMFMAEGAHAGGYATPRADRFATIATTGSISGDNIYVPFNLPSGAGNLLAKKWLPGTTSAGWTYSTPTASELTKLVAVYPGNGAHWANGTPVLITGVTVDNTNKRFVITLDRSGGAGTLTYFNNGGVISQTAQLTVQMFSDFHVTGEDLSWCAGVFDDRIIDDWAFGPHVRPQLDIVCS